MKSYLIWLAYRLIGWWRLETHKNFGFLGVGEKEEQKLGVTWEVLQPSGQWDTYLPRIEYQRLSFGDTMACVTFSLYNTIETLIRRVYNQQWDFSDRYTAKMSGTTKSGNTMGKVFNSVQFYDYFVSFLFWQNEGVSWDDFYKEIPEDIQKLAKQNKGTFDFSIDWIFSINQNTLKEALTYSPIWVALYAYGPKVDGVYQPVVGTQPNHCVMIYGYDENGNWKVYDHYLGGEHRLLAPNYPISAAAKLKVVRNY